MPGHSGLISGSAKKRGKIRDALRDSFQDGVLSLLQAVSGYAEEAGRVIDGRNKDDMPIGHALKPETALIPSDVRELGDCKLIEMRLW